MKKTIALLAAGILAFANSTFATGDVATGGTTPPATKAAPTAQVVACIKQAALTRE
ncbi:hypothetical protein KA478_03525 [Patescibacteria group bacterium]|nr:hypothetical protein [Patescibacteria group bacterium]